MWLQIINTKREKQNQIRSTKATLFQDIKANGWRIQDCKVTELKEALVNTVYRGTDGKNSLKR
jgi:hypothetical protein